MPWTPANNNLCSLTLAFSGDDQGWKEKLWLLGTDTKTLLVTANQLIQYRVAFLPSDCSLDYAKVSKWGQPRDAKIAGVANYGPGLWLGAPTTPSPAPFVPVAGTDKIAQAKTAVQYRLETAEGSWSNRWLHGIPRLYTVEDELSAALAAAVTPPPPIGDPTFSIVWFDIFGYYFYLIKSLTAMAARNPAIPLAPGMYSSPIDVCTFRKLGTHKVGRPTNTAPGRVIRR